MKMAGQSDRKLNKIAIHKADLHMSHLRGLCFAFFSVTLGLISGCATSIRGFPNPPDSSIVTAPTPGYQLGPGAVQMYNAETDLLKKKAIRNDIIDARMAEIDSKFGEFERALYVEGIGAGIGTDWTVLALTAASSLSTVKTVKTIYATTSTAVVGGNAAFDKRALYDKTLPSLLAQMVAQRETIRLSIRTSEQLPVDSYSLFAAESELQNFLFAGSIPGAIASVAQDAGLKASTAQRDLKQLTNASYVKTASSNLLLKFWKPDGKAIDTSNQTALREWLKNNGFATDAGSITMFIYDGSKEDSRAKAAKDLGLPH